MRSCPGRCPSAPSTNTVNLVAALFLLSLLPTARAWALRTAESAPAPRVQVYALWNPDYLCLSAKVPDIMLTGSSAGPMSAPQQDDAIEFDLEAPTPRGPEAHRLIISVAGGMAVLTRDAQGRWRPDQSWISGTQMLKYAVSLNGTLNNPAGRDVGYTVECAIPWKFLGGEPPVDQVMGFNVTSWTQGEAEGIVSWMQTVANGQDIGDTTRWGRMLITASPALATAEGSLMPCPFGRMPFIDGKLTAEEWMTASTLSFEKPQPPVGPVVTPAKQSDAVGTLLAIYRYDWQGDPARPGAHLWQVGGGPATSDQPKEAAGPWYSWERVAWHRAQLNEIVRAGIDIILASYRGDDESRRTWARAGLGRLSEALKGMRAEGRSYPLVGMMLDTGPLAGVNLKSDEGKRLLYGMISDFFLHVPREFWAELPTRAAPNGAGGVPILLGEPDGLADWDGAFLSYAQECFRRDFDGAQLAWLGSSQWRTRGADGFYAYVRLPGATGLIQEGAEGATAVAISPGFCPPPGTTAEIRPRREGRAYRSDWQRVLATAPELVILNSWNDFTNGNDLAPSRQYGFTYVDATRYFAARMSSKEPHFLRLRKQAVPRVMRPGTDYRIELLVKNLGTQDLRTGRSISVDYRVSRRSDGAVVQSKTGALDLSIMAGQTLRLPVVVSTTDDRGRPLPPGDYVFSLVAVRSSLAYFRSPWFAKPAAELKIPITVGAPPARLATMISTSLPSIIESGATEQVVVRMRNDSAAAWRAADTALCYRWLRHADDLRAPSSEEVIAEGARVSLPKDVPPGEIVSVVVSIAACKADGSSLPPSQPADLWHYRVQWDLIDKQGPFLSEKAPSEAIQVLSLDRGVTIESAAIPAAMQAGEQAKIDAVVMNAGPRAWAASNSYLTYHWYRWDGRQISGKPDNTRPPSDVPRRGKAKLTTTVAAPVSAGPYWLVWDMVANGAGFSSSGGGRGTDLLVSPVMVMGGRFRAIDLSKFTNIIAVTDDAHRGRGDFDGEGHSFPAEWLPPDQTGATEKLYPVAYYSPATPPAEVPFVFPDTSSGIAGAVACDGQSIPLGEKGAKRVHLLVADTMAQRDTPFALKLADGNSEQVTVTILPWRGAVPGQTQDIGIYAPHVRALTSDDATLPACLYHKTIAPSSASAVTLELPKEPSVKILAITVEE